MKRTLLSALIFTMTALVIIPACRKKDAPLPDNQVQFESDQQGMDATENSRTIKIRLSRAVGSNVAVNLQLTATPGVDYGTDYTTSPATTGDILPLNILSGSNEASFTITREASALFFEGDKIVFRIISSEAPVIIGDVKELTLNFSEIISGGATITGDGGGPTYGNKVFFDLSGNSQTAVQRTKWDLGFYAGNDDWRVILNSSTAMMARQIDKADLASVTAADTVGFSTSVAFNQLAPTTESLAYIDYPDGDLSRTAIAGISANAADNKVYIINRGTGIGTPAPARGWKKVRIIRNAGGGYTLQHADIASTTFTSVDISKDANYFFQYVSFENGPVPVEPPAKKWDIAWTFFSNVANFGSGDVPYTYQDIVLQNRNVQTAKVMTSTRDYADFGEADLAGITWTSAQNGIGADWRSGGGPGTAPAVRPDRYYILKDGDNNIYKVRFTSMTQNGDRGYPAFEFALVKKG